MRKMNTLVFAALMLTGCAAPTQVLQVNDTDSSSGAQTTSRAPRLQIWTWGLIGDQTRDIVVTPMSDLYLNISIGEPTVYHMVWKGQVDEEKRPIIMEHFSEEFDPQCYPNAVGFRFQLFQDGREIFWTKQAKANLECSPDVKYVGVMWGGRMKSERRDGSYLNLPWRMELDAHNYTCPRDSHPYDYPRCGTHP